MGARIGGPQSEEKTEIVLRYYSKETFIKARGAFRNSLREDKG